MALISPVMYNAQIYSVPLSDRPIRPSSSLPFSLPGPAATTEKKKGGEREKKTASIGELQVAREKRRVL